MASSLLKALTLLSDGISFSFLAQTQSQRRGFAAAAAEAAVRARQSPKSEDKAAAVAVAQLFAGKQVAGAADPDPWVPDPVTGCYRPGNQVVEVDAAELRAALLGPKA